MRVKMKSTAPQPPEGRWWDLPAALLLLAVLLTAAFRLSSTNWTEHLNLIQTVTILGLLAGLALGQSRFSPVTARLFALAYGLFVIPWQLGLTLGEGILWNERLVSLGNRLWLTINQLTRTEPITDNMFFIALMACLFWFISTFGGYNLTRYGSGWRAILPPGLAIVLIHAYDSFFPIRTWFLAGYLFFSLLLLARVNFLAQFRLWKQHRAYLPPYLGLDFIRFALVITAILVIFSWTAPALATAITPAEKAWRQVTSPWIAIRERLSNAFSALQSSVGFVTDFYGDTLALGRGNPLTDMVVLTVETPPLAAPGVRYYWRARVYDQYEGYWVSSLPETRSLSPNNPDLEFPEFEGRSIANFTIITHYPIQNIYTPAQPIWVSRPVEAQLSTNSDGTVDLGILEANPYLNPGEVYQVEASLSSATIAQLRKAGNDYPDWVLERYLQVPDSITPRMRQLAFDIAGDLDNPYEITQAVTNWLRNNLVYSETIPAPPIDQDPLDWVLFEHGEGFCNYYASAEVILLRILGIPARLAVGYAQGERLSSDDLDAIPTLAPRGLNIPQEELGFESDRYTVRQRDAHAWPEVFFPDLGWVEFEPTSSQAPIFRPPGVDAALDEAENQGGLLDEERPLPPDFRDEDPLGNRNQSGASGVNSPFQIPFAGWLFLATTALATATLFIRRIRRERGSPPLPIQLEEGLRQIGFEPPAFLLHWARFARLSPITRAYFEINRALTRLGRPAQPTETPAERARSLSGLLPSIIPSIQALIKEYQLITYSREPGNEPAAQEASRQIRKNSYLALIQRFLSRWQEPVTKQRTSS
jgi:transglutaminase-like putative cysteine protease